MKKSFLGLLTGSMCIGSIFIGMSIQKRKQNNSNIESKKDKFKDYYYMLDHWFCLNQNGESIESYFHNNNITKISIYGMGEMGQRLYHELKDSDIEIAYAVDQNADSLEIGSLEIINKDNKFEKVDAMIVTPTFAYEQICSELSDKVSFPLISLEDIIYSI